jgi:chromosome segregation ATPase
VELDEREGELQSRQAELFKARQQLEDDLRELERKREDRDEAAERAHAKADSGGDAAYRELGAARQKLRAANDAATEKAKQLLGAEAALQTAMAQLSKAASVEQKLRDDFLSLQARSKKKFAKGERNVTASRAYGHSTGCFSWLSHWKCLIFWEPPFACCLVLCQ